MLTQVEREVGWIINDHFPPHLEAILSLLRVCQAACCESDAVGPAEGGRPLLFPSATLVLSTVGTDVLKGFVTLDGPKISKAEVQIHLPSWNKGHPVPVHLDAAHPTELPQIAQCNTLIELAMHAIAQAAGDRQAISVAASLAEAADCCRQAIGVLENSDGTHPMVHAQLAAGGPEDLVLSFGVQNARIVAAAFVIVPAGAASTSSLKSGGGTSRSSLPGHPLSSAPEMLVRVDSVVPALTAAHEILVHCVSSLCNLRSQLCRMLNKGT